MLTLEGIDQNLRFLIVEVQKQVAETRRFVESPERRIPRSVIARDDYIDNLKSIIQRKCFAVAAKAAAEDEKSYVDQLRSIDVITGNLERIADFCENIIDQVGHVQNKDLVASWRFGEFFDEINAALEKLEEAIFQHDVQTALAICRREHTLDKLYAASFRRVLEELETGEDAQSRVTLLFVAHYFERIGDALQNIGEAVISAALGERIKIDQFWALEDSLESTDVDPSDLVSLKAMGETRSGCRIDRVDTSKSDQRALIFKEGRTDKLIKEKESIERWQELFPGLVPNIYSFHQTGEIGAILFEYLRGHTLEDILIRGDLEELDGAVDKLCETVAMVWGETLTPEQVPGKFMEQLAKRLPDVYAVHPDFSAVGGAIGTLRVPSFEDLVDRAREVDEKTVPPFSVHIHGDFNVDNVIFNDDQDALHFIDLGRSRRMDYVQDVSVFLVSNHRLQVFRAPVRKRIAHVVGRFTEFTRGFAKKHGDTTFEARLALGLARSLATSTRFMLDKNRAKAMFLRSRYLLERILKHEGDLSSFVIPKEALLD